MTEYKSGACLAHSLARLLSTRATDLWVREGDPGPGNGGWSGLAFPDGWRRIFLIFREPPSEIVRRNGDGAMGGLVLGGGSKFPKKSGKYLYDLEIGFWVVEHWSTRHIVEFWVIEGRAWKHLP